MNEDFPAKYAKIIEAMPEFKDIAESSSTDDLKKLIVTCEGNIYTIEKSKEKDEKLTAAKEIVKEYSAPYNDAIKAQTAKVKYILYLLESKGVDISEKEED